MATRSGILRRRDRYLALIVSGVAACNVATTALYWLAVRGRFRAVEDSISGTTAQCDETRATVSDLSDAVRVLVDWAARSIDSRQDASVPSPSAGPVLVGRGTTKTHSGTRLAWVDYRVGTGAVERVYMPIQSPVSSASNSGRLE